MRLKLKFNFETEELYDDKAKVIFDGISSKDEKIIGKLTSEICFLEAVIFRYPLDVEETNLNRIAGFYDDVYVRECRRAWDNLWDYFGVIEYREQCFPKGESLKCTQQEIVFLGEYFGMVCRKTQDKKSNDKREVKSFLDRRKKNHEMEDKEYIEWASGNLYHMIKERIGITEDIQRQFAKAMKGKSLLEDNLNNITELIQDMKQFVLDSDEILLLNEQEKEICSIQFIEDIGKVVNQWRKVLKRMNALKQEDIKKEANERKYNGIVLRKCLLEDAIKNIEETK